MIDELNLLVSAIVGEAIIDEDVEPVPLWPHVDGEGDGVTHVDRSSNSISGQSISGPDLHETLGRGQGEDHWVGCVSSGDRWGERALVTDFCLGSSTNITLW